MISGSFRAFDRRPLEIASDMLLQHHQGDGAGTSSQHAAMAGKAASSSGTSDSGDVADLPQPSGNNNNADMETNEGLEQTLLEWEQQWPYF